MEWMRVEAHTSDLTLALWQSRASWSLLAGRGESLALLAGWEDGLALLESWLLWLL